ncbi:MAG: hypothetical protein BroJett011_40540 [Chloroflexota bacterium]|nr:MAG: hypothetical protein BroJett011_40540 [Chloroflexota bacterium]
MRLVHQAALERQDVTPLALVVEDDLIRDRQALAYRRIGGALQGLYLVPEIF